MTSGAKLMLHDLDAVRNWKARVSNITNEVTGWFPIDADIVLRTERTVPIGPLLEQLRKIKDD